MFAPAAAKRRLDARKFLIIPNCCLSRHDWIHRANMRKKRFIGPLYYLYCHVDGIYVDIYTHYIGLHIYDPI